MRRLLLFRHAEAVHSAKYSDRDRPLTQAGRREAARVGDFLAEKREKIDLVRLSDSIRTRESWDLAQEAYGAQPPAEIDPRLYRAERRDLLDIARDLPDEAETAAIVGHNPAMAEFANKLAGGGDHHALKRLAHGFPTGGLAIFEADVAQWRDLRWGDGKLDFFFT